MDKRINFLNRLKKRLNSYIISGSKNKNNLHQKNYVPIINYSMLRSQMLCENVQSGMALGGVTFDSSHAYAEFSRNGKLNFHIYPTIIETREPLLEKPNEYKENEELKHAYANPRIQ